MLRKSYITLLTGLAVMVAGAALAWACTPSSYINLSSSTGRSGDQVTIAGEGFFNGPVQIYWNGPGGRELARAQGPSFTVTVRIPNAAPGVHYLNGVARTKDGNIVGNASRAFRVQAAVAPAPSSGTPGAARNDGGDGGPAAPATKPSPKGQGGRAVAHTRTDAGRDAERAASQQARSSAPVPQQPAVTRTGSEQAVFTDSLPPAAREASASENGHRGSNAGSPADPRARQAGSGVFGLGDRAGWNSNNVDEPGPQLGFGAGLLGLGLVLLLGGFAVAEVRRRRAALGWTTGLVGYEGQEREPDRSAM